MHLKQVQEARALAKPIPHVFTDVDTFPAFVMQAVPNGGTGFTAATVAFVQGGDMTILVDGAAPAGNDAIGTAGVIDTSAAAYDTCGELMDYINSKTPYRMYLVGARRATTMATILAKTAASFLTANGLTFYCDASAYKGAAFAISAEKFVNTGLGGHEKDADLLAENSLLFLDLNIGLTGTTPRLKLYSCSQETDGPAIEFTMADDTDITKGGMDAESGVDLSDVFYQAKLGERLVVEVSVDTTFDDIAKFQVVGSSAVLTGARVVRDKNY